jgi:hypothetical protein
VLQRLLDGQRAGEQAVEVRLQGPGVRRRARQRRRLDAVALLRLQEAVLEEAVARGERQQRLEVRVLLAGPLMDQAPRAGRLGGDGHRDVPRADVHAPRSIGVLRDDLVVQPQVRGARSAQPPVELRVLLLEARLVRVDQVRPGVERLQAQRVALLELIGQERLLEPHREVDVGGVPGAVDLDLVPVGERLRRSASRQGSGENEHGREQLGEGHGVPPWRGVSGGGRTPPTRKLRCH